MGRAAALFAAAVVAACGQTAEPLEERELIADEAWEAATTEADLFAHLRPGDGGCPEDGFGLDQLGELSLEINTGRCNFLTVRQPSLVDISAGDEVVLRIWHFELFSPDQPAEAYAAVAIDGEVAFDTTIPIPAEPGLVAEPFAAPTDAAAGADVQFHLNNHGINSWNLLSINVTN